MPEKPGSFTPKGDKRLVPRAKEGSALIIIGRAARKWGTFPKSRNIIAYTGAAARSAHLTPDSAGGKAMLRFPNEK